MVFLLTIFSWILIDCWGRFINNLTFNLFKLNENSAYDTLLIALCLTLIIFFCIVYLKSYQLNYEKNIAGETFSNENDNTESPVHEPNFFSFIDFV